MALSVTWATGVIFVPKADLTLVGPGEIYEMQLNTYFRVQLKALEGSAEGMVFLDAHRHNTQTILGGVVYARQIEIINGYTVTFENGIYAVNIVGANSNVGDAGVHNVNSVSLRSANSAGLIVVDTGGTVSAIAKAVWDELRASHVLDGSFAQSILLMQQMLAGKTVVNPSGTKITVYAEDLITPLATYTVTADQRTMTKDP